MPQVSRTTNDVIVNALYMLGELGVGETPDNFMLTTGLELLNELLDKFAADSIFIPFLTTIDFNFAVGVDTYSISDIVPANITQDRVVDLTFANYFVPATGSPAGSLPITFPFNADPTTDLLTLPTTGSYITGTPVTFNNRYFTISVSGKYDLLHNTSESY